ncbi:MAG: bifunctional serine/threonine-protein kinase/formylglycine-generating enzyme family protein [Planctomycetota bacterium]|jgi:serine/threonine protein kinase/formylglycine-generating enzyme required for sulfatase activity
MEEPTIALPTELLHELDALRTRVGNGPACAAGVEALIAAHPQHAAALRRWRAQHESGAGGDATALPVFGAYRAVSLLGSGGFGDVYLAEQSAPVRRRVALKVLKRGMDSAAILQRFAREQDALARMGHDAIAKILDAGVTPGGQPFFAMELVDGVSITVHCDRERLPLEARVRLFVDVCHGVQHAHQKGVVHRDLKPGNVLVARVGERHQPKLIDFGIARALVGDEAAGAARDATLTEAGVLLGTPAYMSPEQLRSDHAQIDTRTDVYALGAILFELLTGMRPLAGDLGAPIDAFVLRQRQLASDTPRPSAVVGSDATTLSVRAELRQLQPRAWQRALRSDLDWIVLRAMAKEPERRYASAAEFAADLERYLRGEAVLAGPPSVGYRLRKFAQRHRAQVLAGAAVVVALVGGGVATFVQYVRAEAKARENAALAVVAQSEKVRADAKVDEFELLAGVVQHERVRAHAAELGPAWPERVPRFEAWLRDDWTPLAGLRPRLTATVTNLRTRALPWTDAERAADRLAHPQYAKWLEASNQLAAVERALPRPAGTPAPTLPELPESIRGSDLGSLLRYCQRRIAPKWADRAVAGEEPLGLAAARHVAAALPASQSHLRSEVLEALAWAELANGDHEAARRCLAEARELVADQPDPLALRQATTRELEATIAALPRLRAELQQRVASLAPSLDERRTWSFAADDAATRFLHEALTGLLRELDRLEAETVAQVARELRWAKQLAQWNGTHPRARVGWDDVRKALAASAHASLRELAPSFAPLPGLVPLGANPRTGLLEFYDLRSAWDGSSDPAASPIPRHDAEGRIVFDANDVEAAAAGPGLAEAAGITFVLLPGGTFVMGAQNTRPEGDNHDPAAREGEDAHHVTLAPFLLARHELTQAQWARLWRGDPAQLRPSQYGPGTEDRRRGVVTAAHPVEQVSWPMANALAADHGCVLPTEAMWEYGCRAGSETPYWCGSKPEELGPLANLLDRTAFDKVKTWGAAGPFDDGAVLHWPVGSGRANAFGLHDVHGNVFEWCRERYIGYEFPTDLRSGERLGPPSAPDRCCRGGSFSYAYNLARAAMRMRSPESTRLFSHGVRLARELPPAAAK